MHSTLILWIFLVFHGLLKRTKWTVYLVCVVLILLYNINQKNSVNIHLSSQYSLQKWNVYLFFLWASSSLSVTIFICWSQHNMSIPVTDLELFVRGPADWPKGARSSHSSVIPYIYIQPNFSHKKGGQSPWISLCIHTPSGLSWHVFLLQILCCELSHILSKYTGT